MTFNMKTIFTFLKLIKYNVFIVEFKREKFYNFGDVDSFREAAIKILV